MKRRFLHDCSLAHKRLRLRKLLKLPLNGKRCAEDGDFFTPTVVVKRPRTATYQPRNAVKRQQQQQQQRPQFDCKRLKLDKQKRMLNCIFPTTIPFKKLKF